MSYKKKKNPQGVFGRRNVSERGDRTSEGSVGLMVTGLLAGIHGGGGNRSRGPADDEQPLIEKKL